MTKIKVTCRYCGLSRHAEIHTRLEAEQLRCALCDDPELIVTPAEESSGDVFGYYKGGSDEQKD